MIAYVMARCWCSVCRKEHDHPIERDAPPRVHRSFRDADDTRHNVYLARCFECTVRTAAPFARAAYERYHADCIAKCAKPKTPRKRASR